MKLHHHTGRAVRLGLLTGVVAGAALALPSSAAHADDTTTIAANHTRLDVFDHHITTRANGGTIPDQGPAAVYPITAPVTGTGLITDIDVELEDLDHSFPDDLDIMLVGPDGTRVMLMSDMGGTNDLNGATLRFDDDAASFLLDDGANLSGTYRPADVDPGQSLDPFPAPAPDPASARTRLAAFNGHPAAGPWQLFVMDDSTGDGGRIDSMRLHITTDATASSYPAAIEIPATAGRITDLDVNLHGFSHTFPQDLQLALVGPRGQGVLLMSDAGGEITTDVELTFDDEAPAMGDDTTRGGTFRPTRSPSQDVEAFAAPGPPSGSLGDRLSVFDGTDASGTWRLFALDDEQTDQGSLRGGWSLEITATDQVAPRVLGARPHRPKRAAPGTDVTLTFSEAMRPTSLSSRSVRLRQAGTSDTVPARFRWHAGSHRLVIDPVGPLRPGTAYVVTVSGRARDAAGNRLDQSSARGGRQTFVARFTTR